jgi:hypothetical protein
VEAEKMMEERAAEASELDERLAEQESMNEMRLPDGDSDYRFISVACSCAAVRTDRPYARNEDDDCECGK